MTNRYAASCAACGGRVPAKGGALTKVGGVWQVRHLACEHGPAVVTVRFAGGHTITRNARGTCEDAPCCGCCTF
jgi:hypothetical protein